ncbi:adenylate kinase family enzyme [Barrientosiimonas humi]|uniref:Adenylate kinase family enzyme n=1 Tax=Barrientosiimonas humi TaxID=999931 RepID=A0A542XCH7_9MICO|nr:AAA family ATPase [Barrientosiimonas humi]TQL33543.1 adenylate kinase family enzyme [Barrientosiimonas humi]CAG7573531.1 hypothetical protein BH39T_PBIAJDOK_02167 [Barrientosiimonas humi]
MSVDQHLIVIRGNSASGKSTVAVELQRRMGRGAANVGQDHLRRVVLREHDVPDGDNIGLIEQTAQHCLQIGYHVILEGILYSGHYGNMLRRLMGRHDGPTHVFYLDVPLEETLRRHAGRPLASEVDSTKLREWFLESDVLGVPGEVVLGGEYDVGGVVDRVLQAVGPVRERTSSSQGKFL